MGCELVEVLHKCVKVKKKHAVNSVETMCITLEYQKGRSSMLIIIWETSQSILSVSRMHRKDHTAIDIIEWEI